MKRLRERYACLCAEEFPLQALLRLRPELRDWPCAVLEGAPPLQQVCSLNSQASACGAERGMTKVELETLPTVAALARSGGEEASARAALLACAGDFSPSLEDCSDNRVFLCVLDIAGTDRLHGEPVLLAQRLLERMHALGVRARVAVADNFHAAVCLARGMPAKERIRVVAPGTEEAALALAPLPLHVLDLTEEQAQIFALWGIKTLGMLAQLPEMPLIARMGQEGGRLRQLARGTLPHHFVPLEPRFALDEFMELDSPVEILESLLFVVGIMLEQMIARAASRSLALASVTIMLALEGGMAHTRTIRPALPTNDKQLWIKLLHLDLDAHPPAAAILSLRLQAEPGPTSHVQLGLFSPQLPDATRLDVTLARIRAIVGEACVGSPSLHDSHRPDDFTMRPFAVSPASMQSPPPARKLTALRRLRPPEDVTVVLREQRPAAIFFRHTRYDVEHAYGPWLSSGAWWSDTRWRTQQWDIVARPLEGPPLLSCLICDLTQNCWQMAGLYD